MTDLNAETLLAEIEPAIRHTRSLQALVASETSGLVIFAVVLVSVVLPLIEGVLGTLITPPNLGIWVAVIGIHATLAAFTIRGTLHFRDVMKLVDINKLEDIMELLNTQNKEIKTLKSQYIAIHASLTFLREFLVSTKPYDLEKDMANLLSPLVREKERILGFQSEAFHNFCLNIFNPNTQKLEVKWRDCHPIIEIDRKDRSWGIGEGHIGLAYARNAILITGDASDNPVYTSANPEDRDRDNRYYRSFVSIAITSPDSRQPIGVLAITSNVTNQFNEDFRLLCEIYRVIVSTYLNLWSSRENS